MRRITHIIATCNDCNWRTEDFINGRTKARKHAKKYKHRVWGEVGRSFVYDYREKK